MRLFSKTMMKSLAIAVAIVLSLLGEISYAWPAWRNALLSSDNLTEQALVPTPILLSREEFAEAIKQAMR